MSDTEKLSFFVSILKKKGLMQGFRLSWTPPTHEDLAPEARRPELKLNRVKKRQLAFESVLRDFDRSMTMYLRFIPLLLQIGPDVWSAMASQRVEEFAKSRGQARPDLDVDDVNVFEVDRKFYGQYVQRSTDVFAVMQSSDHIPQVMIVGLISTYDFFLSQLLRATFNSKPELIFTSQKQIAFSDLLLYGSIEDAKSGIIDREIEGIIRESHQEHFTIMERIFDMKLRKDLAAWPRFVEVCERRNLFTHTGGVVSQQYLSKCKEQKCDIGKIALGDTLEVKPEYFRKAVQVVYEVGTKLNYVLWRKFAKDQAHEADEELSELAYDLICRGQYAIAESILEFGSTIMAERRGREHTRRMMIVNLANAVRLQGRDEQARAIVEREDWSASDDVFQICVAAVKGDLETLIALMRAMGASGKMREENYRDWPVFSKHRNKKEFEEEFKNIFGESLAVAEAKRPPVIIDAEEPTIPLTKD